MNESLRNKNVCEVHYSPLVLQLFGIIGGFRHDDISHPIADARNRHLFKRFFGILYTGSCQSVAEDVALKGKAAGRESPRLSSLRIVPLRSFKMNALPDGSGATFPF